MVRLWISIPVCYLKAQWFSEFIRYYNLKFYKGYSSKKAKAEKKV
jgi:hypothetical protein